MTWKNNFNEIHLSLNTPITFSLYEEKNQYMPVYEFNMRIPTVEEVYTDNNFMLITALLNTDIEEIQQQFPMIINLSTHFMLFNILLIISQKNELLKNYVNKLVSVFNKLNIPISINSNNTGFVISDYDVTYELFSSIQKILLICIGIKKISDYAIDDPIYAEMQKKINRIKRNGSNVKEVNSNNFLESLITLTYEFGFTIEEIKQMNIFQMNTYLGYVGNSINYKVSLIAAGNGLTKKVKYITHKGK